VREKVVAIFAEAEPFVPSENVDAQLYNGFFSDADRAAMNIVLETEPRNLPALDITFADKRIEKLMFNYRARNFPGTLDEDEQQRWLQHRRHVFTPEFCRPTPRSWRCCTSSMKTIKKAGAAEIPVPVRTRDCSRRITGKKNRRRWPPVFYSVMTY
jgi:exonuclease I